MTDSPGSSEQSPVLDQLLQMHSELLAMVGALLEQNQQILAAVSDVTDDFEGKPRTYMDGSPIT